LQAFQDSWEPDVLQAFQLFVLQSDLKQAPPLSSAVSMIPTAPCSKARHSN